MQTYATPGRLSLRLRLAAGTVRLEATQGETTEVDVTPVRDDELSRRVLAEARIGMREDGDGREVFVELPQRKGWGFGREAEFDVVVRAPAGADVDAETASADVRGRGRFGAVSAHTASGDVEFDEIERTATVKTASGDVQIRLVGGTATARTASGDVEVDRALGHVEASLVSGDLSIRDARSSVTAKSVSGDLHLNAVEQGAVTLETVSGDVAVGVREGSNVWFDARTLSGTTSSELDLGDVPPADDEPLVEVRAKTVSGDIRLRRAPARLDAALQHRVTPLQGSM